MFRHTKMRAEQLGDQRDAAGRERFAVFRLGWSEVWSDMAISHALF